MCRVRARVYARLELLNLQVYNLLGFIKVYEEQFHMNHLYSNEKKPI